MKKRILSIVLATALILAMAIPASAATVSDSGSYTGSTGTCSYHWQAYCSTTSWRAFIEWTGSTDSYTNYLFRSEVVYWPSDGMGGYNLPVVSRGTNSTMIGEIYGSGAMYKIDADFFVNNSRVGQARSVMAS